MLVPCFAQGMREAAEKMTAALVAGGPAPMLGGRDMAAYSPQTGAGLLEVRNPQPRFARRLGPGIAPMSPLSQ